MVTAMITTRALPALLPAHHRRVARPHISLKDFADPLGEPPRSVAVTNGRTVRSPGNTLALLTFALGHRPSKLVFLATALVTEETSNGLTMAAWSRMTMEAAKAPHQTATGL